MSATMATRAAVSWLRSSRSLLAGSALLDLVFRLPEDIITPGLSLASGLVGSPTVGFVTTWLMITVAFYTFAPLGYSHLDVLPRDTPGFRGIFAAGAIGLGLVIQWTDDLGILFGALFLDMLFLTGLF